MINDLTETTWNHNLTTSRVHKLLIGLYEVSEHMKFFVPFTIGSSQAEQIYDRSKKRLAEIGFQVSDVRIQQLVFQQEGELVNRQVGDVAPNEEIIAAILQSDAGYFVCTFCAANSTELLAIRYTQLILEASLVAITYFDYP